MWTILCENVEDAALLLGAVTSRVVVYQMRLSDMETAK